MYAEYFGCNDGSDGKAIEYINKCLPDLDVTSSFTFIVETIY